MLDNSNNLPDPASADNLPDIVITLRAGQAAEVINNILYRHTTQFLANLATPAEALAVDFTLTINFNNCRLVKQISGNQMVLFTDPQHQPIISAVRENKLN
jgi:hypothetical protein